MKEKCAQIAFEMIEDGMIVGLGGGSTVALIIEKLGKSQKKITVVTPSYDTYTLCLDNGIVVQDLEITDSIDLTFDGCDELDYQLNALKSCGGIHTREKIVASMSKDYILLADQEKYKESLAFSYPITIEVLPKAHAYVRKVLKNLGAQIKDRKSPSKAGLVITDDGNYLLEANFQNVSDLAQLSSELDKIAGLVGHSLFYQIASKAIIAKQDGVIIEEGKNK